MRDFVSMVLGVVIFVAGLVTGSLVHHLDGTNQCPYVNVCCDPCDCDECDCCQGCCK